MNMPYLSTCLRPASRFTVLGGGVNNATAMRHWVDEFLDAG